MSEPGMPLRRSRSLYGRARLAARLSALALGACASALALAPSDARAEAPSAGYSIGREPFSLDLFQGALLAPIRVTGIAGAYAGYAEGIEGMVANAAAPANREPFSVNWAEFDISGSVSFPITFSDRNDFDNSGALSADYSDFLYLTGGAMMQLGPFGFGANAELQRYALTSDTRNCSRLEATAFGGCGTSVTIGKFHVLGGVRLLGDQLVLGAGARIATLAISAPSSVSPSRTLVMASAAPEAGVLFRPDWQPFRVGATYRFPVVASPTSGGSGPITTPDARGVLRIPESAVLPWELEVGVAIQVGPRPLNPGWIDPRAQEAEVIARIDRRRRLRDRQRAEELARVSDPADRVRLLAVQQAEAGRLRQLDEDELELAKARLKSERRARALSWPREHLLVTAELLVSGPVDNGVSIQRFLGQNLCGVDDGEVVVCGAGAPSAVGTSGHAASFSPRFGIEAEPVPTWIHTRFGSYYEPGRIRTSNAEGGARTGRQHFTFGADVRLFETTMFDLIPPTIYKFQTSVDIAPRYQSISFGLGVWH